MSETIHFNEQEYRTLETLAKKFNFKNVDELVSTALISFFSKTYDWGIEPEDAKKFLTVMQEQQAKNPDFSFAELLKNWNTPNTPNIETVEVKVKIPKKLLVFLKDKRAEDWEGYLSNCITDTVAADIDAEVYSDPEQIKKEYGLTKEFELYQGH